MLPTVPVLSILCMVVSGLIGLLLPIALLLAARRRYRAPLLPALLGAVSFVLFALVLRPCFNALLFSRPQFSAFVASHWWAAALYGGLTAGLFEETGRLLAFLLLRRRNNSLGSALSYGAGHGGIEAIIFCTLLMLNNIIAAVVINSSGIEAFIALLQAPESVALELTSLAPATFLLAGVERILAFSFHIAASVLVWMAATGRGPWGLYFLSILFHTMVNFPSGLLSCGIVGSAWAVEGIIAVVVLIICLVTAQIYWKCSQFYSPLLRYSPSGLGRK